jgi:hypothetical protein
MTGTNKMIAEIIEHLRKGEDSRVGFMAKIDNLYLAVDALEKWNMHVEKENAELRDQLALGVPVLTFNAFCEQDTLISCDVFEWRMEPVMWRCRLPRGALKWEQKAVDRMKRRAYRELLKKIKKSFLSNWEFNVSR